MRYVVVMLLVAGCYGAPDYDGTHFKCDADHPCPAGQQCVGGLCGGGGSNSIDAATSAMGVQCGSTACAASQKCCADFVRGPTCIALAATCAGIAAACDGLEDCTGGACCDSGGGTQIACAATCSAQTVCLENADCANASGAMCCMIPGTNEPWGRCLDACP